LLGYLTIVTVGIQGCSSGSSSSQFDTVHTSTRAGPDLRRERLWTPM